MYGTLEELADGRWRLRFTRELAHPVDKVWRAITEPPHLAAWFPTTIEGEYTPGARLHFVFPKDEAPPMDGEVIAYLPDSAFEFQWGPDVIRLEVRPSGNGTTLTLLHTFAEQGKAARDGAGWHTCLDALAAWLQGQDSQDSARRLMNRWAEVHPRYVEQFGPEAATIGPPG